MIALQLTRGRNYIQNKKERNGIDRVYNDIYTDMKIANDTKIKHIIVAFTDHYNAIFIDRLPSETKIEKDSRYFNNFFYVSPSSPQHPRLMISLISSTAKAP